MNAAYPKNLADLCKFFTVCLFVLHCKGIHHGCKQIKPYCRGPP